MDHTTNHTYQILLTRQPTAAVEDEPYCWRATVLGLPELVSEACSRTEALERIRERLTEFLNQAEIVTLNVPSATTRNGASELEARGYRHYGAFANDPEALKLFDEIEEARNQSLIEPVQI